MLNTPDAAEVLGIDIKTYKRLTDDEKEKKARDCFTLNPSRAYRLFLLPKEDVFSSNAVTYKDVVTELSALYGSEVKKCKVKWL